MQQSRHIKIFLGALSLVFFLSGCHSEKEAAPSPPEAANAPAHASAPASLEGGHWLLRFEARCAGASVDRCKGAYGFLLQSDGSFKMGPAPGQQLVTGNIDEQELKELALQVAALAASDVELSRQPSPCQVIAGDSAGQSLQLTIRGHDRCVEEGEVLSSLQALVMKYYPDQFPNPCLGAAGALEKEYALMRACDQDSDCAYLNLNFLPVETGLAESVFVDNCTYLRPLPVGNSFLVVSNQLKLLLQRDIATQICGDAAQRPACARSLGFDSRTAPPVCVNGACTIHSSVEIR